MKTLKRAWTMMGALSDPVRRNRQMYISDAKNCEK